jgi:hypothetical protein
MSLSKRSRSQRFPLLLPLRLWLSGKDRDPEAPAQEETVTANISSTGCYFRSSKAPALGNPVQMEIAMQVPGAQPHSKVIASGHVVRIEKEFATGKTGVACKFVRQDLVRTSED